MDCRFFLTTTSNPKLIRTTDGLSDVYRPSHGWVEEDYWYYQIFLGDFTDFKEITEEEAMSFIQLVESSH